MSLPIEPLHVDPRRRWCFHLMLRMMQCNSHRANRLPSYERNGWEIVKKGYPVPLNGVSNVGALQLPGSTNL